MGYCVAVETAMKTMYDSLREKDRRRYAAVEAAKLGHGGVFYIARLLGCDAKTLRRGRRELAHLPELPRGRCRQKGAAGRAG